MKGQAYIKLADEADAKYVDLNEYGIILVRGWREALLTPTGVKSFVTNDNRLEHGITVIANPKNTKMDKRDVSISFFLEGSDESDYLQKYENFLNKIAYNGQICLKVPSLKKVFKFVYSSCTKYGDYGLKRSNFTLKLTEYNPNDRETL
jgi:hypothetical protein